MTGGGFYCIARAVWDDPEFPKEKYSVREAWLWFCGQAMWREGKVKTFAGTLHLDRGELCFSERFLADKWGWGKSRVNRVLDEWEENGWVDGVTVNEKRGSQRGSQRRTVRVYSIRNYNKNQRGGTEHPDASGAVSGAVAFKKRGKEEEGITENINGAANSDPPSAAQEASQRLWSEGVETLSTLANPSLGETKARSLIGRWLSRKKGLAASPENVLRAILDAAAAGTPQPVPYIEAILKNAAGGVRRDGDDWLIPHGTDEYRAHKQQLTIANSPEIYRWPDTPGHVARAKSRWPSRVASAA